jgi:hypothetical protein
MGGSGSQARMVNTSLSACARPVMLMPRPAACPSSPLATNVIYHTVLTLIFTYAAYIAPRHSLSFTHEANAPSNYRRGNAFNKMLTTTSRFHIQSTSSTQVSKHKVQEATYLLGLAHELTCAICQRLFAQIRSTRHSRTTICAFTNEGSL